LNTCSNNQGAKVIIIKSLDEIQVMLEANQIVAELLSNLRRGVEPGISTFELDRIAEDFCIQRKVTPAFKGYRGFPCCLCVSINEEVVHGIPFAEKKVKER